MWSSEQLNLYKSLFRGREDVFAVRWKKGEKSGYMPACRFDPYHYRLHQMKGGTFQSYSEKEYLPYDDQQIIKHLDGGHLAGIYPLLQDNTSWFIAADFDQDTWVDDCRKLLRKKSRVNETKLAVIKKKKENLIKLLHEPPKLHQVNRASWSLETLCYAYGKKYGTSISMTQASTYIRSEGFRFVKARKVLTSPDPQYREKLSVITGILSRLGPREKFFSVDEFGPFSVRIQGGRSYVKKGETKTFPQRQFSKGRLICTAALELSENQIIHFYSEKKDTEEMIRLVDLLIKQYHNQVKIYFSWDAASWHASKKLYQRIEEINLEVSKGKKGPLVELAPLPASAQFLNVIESVFSGLAKAIIHNSNYDSVEECKRAIDKYFDDRNNYFRQNPKRAGNKIWGNEKHASNFDESKNFKDVKWR